MNDRQYATIDRIDAIMRKELTPTEALEMLTVAAVSLARANLGIGADVAFDAFVAIVRKGIDDGSIGGYRHSRDDVPTSTSGEGPEAN